MVGVLFDRLHGVALRQQRVRQETGPRWMPETVGLGSCHDMPAHSSVAPSAGAAAGSGFYLVSVGLVGAAVIGVFFGIGFLSLTPSIGGTTTSVGASLAPEVAMPANGVLPLPGSGHRLSTAAPAPSAERSEPTQGPDALPALTEAPVAAADDRPPHREASAMADMPTETRTAPAPVMATPAPTPSENISATVAPGPGLSGAEIAVLLEHGDAQLRTGDVASARLFYERAAAAGDARGALRLGATFDPAFLGRAGLGKMRADAAEARSWYGRALDLGAAETKRQPHSLETKQGR